MPSPDAHAPPCILAALACEVGPRARGAWRSLRLQGGCQGNAWSEHARDEVLDAAYALLVLDALLAALQHKRLGGAARVAEGLTTMDEVLACTPPVQ